MHEDDRSSEGRLRQVLCLDPACDGLGDAVRIESGPGKEGVSLIRLEVAIRHAQTQERDAYAKVAQMLRDGGSETAEHTVLLDAHHEPARRNAVERSYVQWLYRRHFDQLTGDPPRGEQVHCRERLRAERPTRDHADA